jgi:hypothetical protein
MMTDCAVGVLGLAEPLGEATWFGAEKVEELA